MQDTTYEDETYPTAEDNESPEEEVRLLSTFEDSFLIGSIQCCGSSSGSNFGIVLFPVPGPDHI
jgi:hypothetical protein